MNDFDGFEVRLLIVKMVAGSLTSSNSLKSAQGEGLQNSP